MKKTERLTHQHRPGYRRWAKKTAKRNRRRHQIERVPHHGTN